MPALLKQRAGRHQLLYRGRESSPGVDPGSAELFCGFAAAAALFAAHRAFIVAASWARRSGVRLSFRFALAATLRPFAPAGSIPGFGVTRRFFF